MRTGIRRILWALLMGALLLPDLATCCSPFRTALEPHCVWACVFVCVCVYVFVGQRVHTYVYRCTCIRVSVCVCVHAWLSSSSPFLPEKQLDRGQGVMGEARARQEDASLLKPQVCLGNPIMAPSSLIPKSAAVRSGNEFSWVPSFWNSLCTQWELNKYLMMVLNLGSQKLFPALTLRAPWDRSGGEVFSLPSRPSHDSKSSWSHSPFHTSCFGEASSSSTASLWLFPPLI